MGLGLKTNFGLDQNETVWCGYKFRKDSENFRLVRNEFQSDTFARGAHGLSFKYLKNRIQYNIMDHHLHLTNI